MAHLALFPGHRQALHYFQSVLQGGWEHGNIAKACLHLLQHNIPLYTVDIIGWV